MDENFQKIDLEESDKKKPVIDDNTKSSEEGSVLMPQIRPGQKNDSSQDAAESDQKSKKKMNFSKIFKLQRPKGKKLVYIGSILAVFVILFVIVGLLFWGVYKDALEVRENGLSLVASAKAQNLPEMKNNLQKTKDSLTDLQRSYKRVVWLSFVPFFGGYISDADHAIKAGAHGLDAGEILINTLEPYADIIGFNPDSEQAASGNETAQERLDFVVSSLPDIIPQADILIKKAQLVQKEVDQIKPNRYPEEFRGRKVRENIKEGIALIDMGTALFEDSKPLLEISPYLLGKDSERTYLVLFQNDKELRPTGGFLTAYSIAKVRKGKFEPVSSSDIYDLDNQYTPSVKAPEPFAKYLKGPYVLSNKYRLRDMNWSPDFAESMELFLQEAKETNIGDIDGIIAVDTQLLVYLLSAMGPIDVPGYGTFSNEIAPECDCPQVIYELESFADVEGPIVWSENEPGKIVFAPENYDNRKKIIGPLMNSILSNALGQSKEKIPALFEAGFKSVMEKHVLLYMVEEEKQNAVETFGIGGNIKGFEGDYLHINDANLGGRKSNLYVTQQVDQEIEINRSGEVVKTVTITYKNPQEHDGWLNSVLPNWTRIYVPAGSELLALEGFEESIEPYDDLGKTVFAGFFELRPLGVAKISAKYKLPFTVDDNYELLIQKQPGKGDFLYSLNAGKKYSEEFYLKEDKMINFGI